MSPEAFDALYHRLQEHCPELLGLALIAGDGTLLLEEGRTVGDPRLIGIVGAALARLGEHISEELGQCRRQEIGIRCQEHRALFYPLSGDRILMTVTPAAVILPEACTALIWGKD
ncbi:MAG: hypothetical protein ACP5D5_03925 [Acidithiobacillus sp.]|uniref:hypothetical protein n=1 Tax=Acidithiobacillus sp. TaxID=1872118 RepID=UPI003CFE86CF